MKFQSLRRELYDYYLTGDEERSKAFADRCFALMDANATASMSVMAQKLLQYDVISDLFEPVLFPHCPFYYETGALTSLSDGARNAKGHNHIQAGGWVFERNRHLFIDQDPALFQKRQKQGSEILYLICGEYNDNCQHFNFNNRPVLERGLRGIYEQAQSELAQADTAEETEFLQGVSHGMLVLRRMAEKFAAKAQALAITATDPECRSNYEKIAAAASHSPWEKPASFYEALAALAFLRTCLGTLEGIGPNTFGRVDKDLYPFYQADLAASRISESEAYDLICQFLIVWDCHYDHDMIMSGYADHELENTYTLGGCDEEGRPLYNELTRMFLQATREEKIIFPKIKCRFSDASPSEYFNEINQSVIQGTSTILYQNDNTGIPALVRSGKTLKEARDYMATGCWDMSINQEKYDHGSYLNLLKPFEFALHRRFDKMEAVEIPFEVYDACQSFDECYQVTVRNSERLIRERISVTRQGGNIYDQVDRYPIFSSTLEDCLQNHRDYTQRGARYNDDYLLMFGLPNIIDSLMVIRTLVYEQQKYTLPQLLEAVRADWNGQEEMRQEALRCSGWGDGQEVSTALANRFNNDLFAICASLKGSYGGRVNMGHLTYTEIRWWGEKTLATPDGRHSGDYFAQGLTPSRLKKIRNVTDVIHSLAGLDPSTLAANSVVNIILPAGKITPALCESFLRAAAHTALQSLQLNITSKEQLLDAQKHPENYPDLIVRVTGFSARFTALSKEWQAEVLSRNFYE